MSIERNVRFRKDTRVHRREGERQKAATRQDELTTSGRPHGPGRTLGTEFERTGLLAFKPTLRCRDLEYDHCATAPFRRCALQACERHHYG